MINLTPIVSEKSNKYSELYKKYSFYLDCKLNKLQIKDVIEQKFNVTVLSVNTNIIISERKIKNTKKGVQVIKSRKFKKAIISISKDQEIDFFEQ